MKQTEHFSIGGYAFLLEPEAAKAAQDYIKDMEAVYSNREILDGIEERMAELLLERVPKGGVVAMADINAAIEILGRPERIQAEEPEAEPEPDATAPRKKLYRDVDNKRIAGVCSGIAAYFNIDVALIRIIFVAVTLAVFIPLFDHTSWCMSGVLAYFIFWICMPPARTATQRWQMRGDDGSAEAVRRNIENGAKEVGAALQQVGQSPAWGTVGRVISIIVGIVLLIISVGALFGEALALFGYNWLGFGPAVSDFALDIVRDYPQAAVIMETPWVQALTVLVCTLPFIGILYGAIMLIFNLRSPKWHPGLVIFVLWLIAVVVLGVLLGAGIAAAVSI